ncbi:TPA: hypothetical protein ACSCQP_003007 [Yersinia enterocolitica]
MKSEWLPVGGYVDIHHAVRDISEWIQGYSPPSAQWWVTAL